MCLYCSADIPEQGRVAGGVKGMNLAEGDKILSVTQLGEDKDYNVAIVTSAGTFKQVMLGTIGKLDRARKGVKICDLDEEDKMICAEPVEDGQKTDILIVKEDGSLAHVNSDDFSLESRTTKGKPLPETGGGRLKEAYSFRAKEGSAT